MTCSPEPSKERGFSKHLEVKCSQCRFTSGVYSSPTVEKHRIGRKTFEGNLLAAASFSESGGGYSAMQKFSQVFSAGALSENAYRKNFNDYASASKEEFECQRRIVLEVVKKAHIDLDSAPDESGVVNISVSDDGTWRKRDTLLIMVWDLSSVETI